MFDAVTAAPFSLSFVVTFPTVTVVNAFGTAVNEESSFASRVPFTTTVASAVSQFAGFAPVSHNS
ncbi:hypothetical protein D3C87_2073510 [compost metagenome]